MARRAEGALEVEKTQARPAPAITTTPAERSLHLANIRERVDLEAVSLALHWWIGIP